MSKIYNLLNSGTTFSLFLPFVSDKVNNRNIWKVSAIIPVAVELIQPVVGRSFDVDDIILNFAGILAGYFIAMTLTYAINKIRSRHNRI